MLNQVNKLIHKKYFVNSIIILLLLVSLYLVILNNNKSHLIEENYAKQQLIDKILLIIYLKLNLILELIFLKFNR